MLENPCRTKVAVTARSCMIALLAVCCGTPAFAKIATVADFYSNCASPSETAARTLIVDPAKGGNGTYQTIAAALQAAKPGDKIVLSTGDYGALALSGVNGGGFITIAAAPGQTPKFTNIAIGGYRPASHWRLEGLTVSSFRHVADPRAPGSLVMIGNSDNIILEGNHIHSAAGTIDWQAQIPENKPADVVPSGVSARQSSCVSIIDNQIRNVFHGIDFGGDQKGNNGKYFLVGGNAIDNFAGDGIEHYGSHVRIENNRITNGHDICNNQCVHSDGIQGWNYNHLPVENTDVTIDGNTIIVQTEPNLVLPADTLQGITIFDGVWDGVSIFNNLIVTDAWHGISVNGVNNGAITNNTIAPTNPGRNTWIMVNRPKDVPQDADFSFVVRNNVYPGKKLGSVSGVTIDHNIALADDEYAEDFVKFDPKQFAFDLRPVKGSSMIGAGSPETAPATDIEGHPRHLPFDIGAYAYQGK